MYNDVFSELAGKHISMHITSPIEQVQQKQLQDIALIRILSGGKHNGKVELRSARRCK